MSNWFLKTLFGYSVAFSTLEKDYVLIHRPFRRPILKTIKKQIQGQSYEFITYDEVSEG